jgi:hypothetical protein
MMGRAAGYSKGYLSWAAGFYEVVGRLRTKESLGTPFTGWPWGDKPRDQYWLSEGMSDFDTSMYKFYFPACEEVLNDPCGGNGNE